MHAPARGWRRFGPFEVDLDAGELRKRGRRLRLQEKPLRILVALLERPGEMVARQHLHERLWAGDTFVDFDHGINNAFKKLRIALGDSAGSPRFIETVGRRGYRFIGTLVEDDPHDPPSTFVHSASPTTVSDSEPAILAIAPPRPTDHASAVEPIALVPAGDIVERVNTITEAPAPESVNRHGRWMVGGLALMAVVAVAGLWMALTGRGPSRWLPAGPGATPVDAASGIRGLAVLPLTNLSGDAGQDYMAYAVTDLLTTELAKLAPLKVISRTSVMSYKPGQTPLEEIARQLGVDTLIEGSVNRYQDRVHVNLRMVNLPTDRHVWAESFEGAASDVVSLHIDIVRAVRAQVERRMSEVASPAASRTPVNSQAYELYLKGSFEMIQGGPRSLDLAIDYFKQALAIDDAVAPAYAGIAFARMRQDLFGDRRQYFYQTEVKDAVGRALALDPNLADAHAAAGFARRYYDWDWAGAEAEFQRAIALNPSLAIAHTEYQFMLVGLGRMDESLREARRATEVDPRAALSWVNEGRGLYAARRYDEAERGFLQAIQLKPDMRTAHVLLARLRIAQRRLADARQILQRVHQPPDPPAIVALTAYLEAVSGNAREARRLIDDPAVSFEKDLVMCAAVHAALGERDRAFTLLENGVARHLVEPNLILGPELDPIRSDPRFARMVTAMRLPPHAAKALITLPWTSPASTQ
jgi:TolB-like protein/DNA-binding winged helix-turn-helix (wHTH) protein/Tfp pilus assembly protein PilF